MDRRCREHEEGLVTLAEGGSAPEAEAHVADCAACAERLASFRRTVAGARLASFDAPADLVARAQALMAPAVRRRFLAQLLGDSLSLAGARRSGLEEFSLHVGTEEHSVRLQFVPTKGGWEVAGRAPSEGWKAVRDGVEAESGPSGRFRLLVPSLEESGFVLRSSDAEIEIPPASELLRRGA